MIFFNLSLISCVKHSITVQCDLPPLLARQLCSMLETPVRAKSLLKSSNSVALFLSSLEDIGASSVLSSQCSCHGIMEACLYFRFQCGVSSANLPKLVGGTETEVDEFPWQAHLAIQPPDTEADVLQCGGVLVHEQVVLTAAHCVSGVRGAIIEEGYILYVQKERQRLLLLF